MPETHVNSVSCPIFTGGDVSSLAMGDETQRGGMPALRWHVTHHCGVKSLHRAESTGMFKAGQLMYCNKKGNK